MGELVQISRDPFARETLMRECVEVSAGTSCDWCGRERPSGRLFAYSVERDGVSRSYTGPHAIKGLFCSVSCMRSHNT